MKINRGKNLGFNSNKSIPDFKDPAGYKLIELLGRGASGTVFRARQLNTEQLVALKILHTDETLDERQRKRKADRFEREIKLCAQLHHPHIVKIVDKGWMDDNRLFAVFEYIPGVTLKDLLIRNGPLPAVKAGELMGQVLDALACAHGNGIVHRDLKPNNIMVTSTAIREHAMVLDFGISTFLPEARLADYQSLTLTGETLGTPSYSAPEQLRGEPPTPMSDLYAWGLVFIECLTGEPVMRGATLAEIFHKQLSLNDVPLPAVIMDHPLSGLLRRVLQKNQKERTGQAASLCLDLQKINLSTIVGDLNKTTGPDSVTDVDHIDATSNISSWPNPECERRQITVLCCSLGLSAIDKTDPELEPFEALQRDLLSLCADIGVRYGGYRAGALGDRLMICFGYPLIRDNDARRAARAALEIAAQMGRRNLILTSRQGIKLELRIGMHTGMVMTRPDSPPAGFTPNIALRLENLARPGTILVSASTRQLLERYIHFEPLKSYPIGSNSQPIETFLLARERQTEAFSFLLTGNARSPMMGRDKELSDLCDILQDNAERKEGKSALIIGEAGIGKSRLVHEIQRRLLDWGVMSRVCRCLPEYRNNALYPVLEMLKAHLGLGETSPPEEAIKGLKSALRNCNCRLDRSIPILCSWLYLPIGTKTAPIQYSLDRQNEILFTVLEQLILNMGNGEPFLLIFEDLHWADATSVELIERIIVAASGIAVFPILTARPEFSVSRQAEKQQLLKLSRLAPKDAKIMIQRITNDKPVQPSTLHLIAERTDSIPLFIEEFSRMLLDMNYLVEQNGVYNLEQRFNSATVPITLQGLLEERLEKLGPAKETAQIAAVIARGKIGKTELGKRNRPDRGGNRSRFRLFAAGGRIPAGRSLCPSRS